MPIRNNSLHYKIDYGGIMKSESGSYEGVTQISQIIREHVIIKSLNLNTIV